MGNRDHGEVSQQQEAAGCKEALRKNFFLGRRQTFSETCVVASQNPFSLHWKEAKHSAMDGLRCVREICVSQFALRDEPSGIYARIWVPWGAASRWSKITFFISTNAAVGAIHQPSLACFFFLFRKIFSIIFFFNFHFFDENSHDPLTALTQRTLPTVTATGFIALDANFTNFLWCKLYRFYCEDFLLFSALFAQLIESPALFVNWYRGPAHVWVLKGWRSGERLAVSVKTMFCFS